MSDIQATGWVFAQVPIWLLCNSEISDGAKTLFSYLKYRQGTDIACWPSKETMAHDLGTTKGTIARRTRELEKHKYLVKHAREGQTTLYEMIAQPAGECERWQNLESERKRKKKDEILAAIPTHAKNDTPPSPKNDTPTHAKNDTHDESNRQESLDESHLDAPSAQPPPCLPEQFTLSIARIKERKFTRSQWESILEAEKTRLDKPPRAMLTKWLENKLTGSGHPAIQAYHSEMGRYPRKNQFQEIIDTVGENGGAELFGQIVHCWKMAGWNPLNIGGMLECHRRGEVPSNGKRSTQSGTSTNGQNLGPDGAARQGEPAAFQGIREWLRDSQGAEAQ